MHMTNGGPPAWDPGWDPNWGPGPGTTGWFWRKKPERAMGKDSKKLVEHLVARLGFPIEVAEEVVFRVEDIVAGVSLSGARTLLVDLTTGSLGQRTSKKLAWPKGYPVSEIHPLTYREVFVGKTGELVEKAGTAVKQKRALPQMKVRATPPTGVQTKQPQRPTVRPRVVPRRGRAPGPPRATPHQRRMAQRMGLEPEAAQPTWPHGTAIPAQLPDQELHDAALELGLTRDAMIEVMRLYRVQSPSQMLDVAARYGLVYPQQPSVQQAPQAAQAQAPQAAQAQAIAHVGNVLVEIEMDDGPDFVIPNRIGPFDIQMRYVRTKSGSNVRRFYIVVPNDLLLGDFGDALVAYLIEGRRKEVRLKGWPAGVEPLARRDGDRVWSFIVQATEESTGKAAFLFEKLQMYADEWERLQAIQSQRPGVASGWAPNTVGLLRYPLEGRALRIMEVGDKEVATVLPMTMFIRPFDADNPTFGFRVHSKDGYVARIEPVVGTYKEFLGFGYRQNGDFYADITGVPATKDARDEMRAIFRVPDPEMISEMLMGAGPADLTLMEGISEDSAMELILDALVAMSRYLPAPIEAEPPRRRWFGMFG